MADDHGRFVNLSERELCVREELKIAVSIALDKFRQEPEQKDLEFPSSLNNIERAYIHRMAQQMGLKSKSRGNGPNRYLTVSKKEENVSTSDSPLKLTRVSCQCVDDLFKRYPLTNKEKQDLQPRNRRSTLNANDAGNKNSGKENRSVTKLSSGNPSVPPAPASNEMMTFRKTLPIAPMREQIISTIARNQVILIAGETGSGKTTQVPQFILEDYQSRKTPCRLVCTQPRRLSAMSVSERVANERGEKLGQTVGYQIRLESRVSPKTILTYCTNGVLLRAIMSADCTLPSITHIFVDEIHERDRFSDFLLIALKDMLSSQKNLKVILMSAALDIELFSKYFDGCPVISVPGRCFEVKVNFLENILKITGYKNKEMAKLAREQRLQDQKKDSKTEKTVTILTPRRLSDQKNNSGTGLPQTSDATATAESDKPFVPGSEMAGSIQALEHGLAGLSLDDSTQDDNDVDDEDDVEDDDDNDDNDDDNYNDDDDGDGDRDDNENDKYITDEMDSAISDAWLKGDDESFLQIEHLIMNEDISVDYQHSETKLTPLMVAAGRGCVNAVQQLLSLGANPNLRDPKYGWTAMKWASKWNHTEIVELLENYIASSGLDNDDITLESQSDELDEESKQLLSLYHTTVDDDRVDHELIYYILSYICTNLGQGAILVFLPGYEDIMTVRDRLLSDERMFGNPRKFQVYILHSAVQPSEQRKAFRKMTNGVRKIVLSTNIAETSVTIDDVVFVIDSGKVKEKSFDALTSTSSLLPVWISKASAVQRRGRAGRCSPGVAFHLFSRVRFESLQEYQLPELLRVPLHEICLHTKIIAGPNISIADFLSRAPEAPAYLVLRNAVTFLKAIEALDPWEDLTELGRLLADLPLEPSLGKMVLYAVVLKCLDPVLTVACALSCKSPFILPAEASEKRAANAIRKGFSSDTFSDHFAILKAFKGWQKARSEGKERVYCAKNFLSSATLDIVSGMRSQIIGQLKVSGLIRAKGGGDFRDLNSNSDNWAVVKAAVCAGMYPNIARVDQSMGKLVSQREKKLSVHTSSCLFQSGGKGKTISQSQKLLFKKLPSDWIIFEEMSRSHTIVRISGCSVVSPATVAIFAGPSLVSDSSDQGEGGEYGRPDYDSYLSESSESDNGCNDKEGPGSDKAELRVDDWVVLQGDSDIINMMTFLRNKMQSLVLRRMKHPGKPWSQVDETIVRTVVKLLSVEEEAIGLFKPPEFNFERSRNDGADSSRDHQKNEHDDYRGGNNRYDQRRGGKWMNNSHGRRNETSQDMHSPEASYGDHSQNNFHYDNMSPSHVDFSQASFFIMKCNNQRNLDISMEKGIWATTPANERKLNKAFKENRNVYLVFSVQGSGHFQGFARMTSSIGKNKSAEFASSALGGVFSVAWIARSSIPFQQAHHLLNPWNDNKKVQISRDGQELEPSVGAELCRLWENEPSRVRDHHRGQPYQHPEYQPMQPPPVMGHWQGPHPMSPVAMGYQAGQLPGYGHSPGTVPMAVPVHYQQGAYSPRPLLVGNAQSMPMSVPSQPYHGVHQMPNNVNHPPRGQYPHHGAKRNQHHGQHR